LVGWAAAGCWLLAGRLLVGWLLVGWLAAVESDSSQRRARGREQEEGARYREKEEEEKRAGWRPGTSQSQRAITQSCFPSLFLLPPFGARALFFPFAFAWLVC